jgi:protein SCO1/2
MVAAGNVVAAGAALALLLLATTPAPAEPPGGRLDPNDAIVSSEQAVGRTVGAYTLIDSNGAALLLAAYRGKPLVISLVYSACSAICPTTTQHLIAAVTEARRIIGPDRFEVLTVGFDARQDTPARMAQFVATQGLKFSNWRVASGDAGTLEALLRDLGFSYRAVAGGFDHIAQTTIIDREGRVYRQVYGDDFPMQMFVEPLKDVVYGTATSFTMGGLADRIKFICTTYDPGAGRYRIDYGLVFGSVIAGLSLLLFGALLLREWRRTVRA